VDVSLTAAWKDTPLLGCHPADCSVQHNLKARSGSNSTNLILEDFGSEPVSLRLEAKSRSLPLWPQRSRQHTRTPCQTQF